MARTREFDPDQALDKAMALFWRKGYSSTSMDDLVKATGVSRYGLYEVFKNKRELYRRSLQRYWELLREHSLGDLCEADASLPQIRAAFERFLSRASTDMGQNGCMICNTATEVSPHDKTVAKDVRLLFDRMTGVFEQALLNAKRLGQLDDGVDAKGWARQLTSLGVSLSVLVRSSYPADELARQVEFSLNLLTKH